VCGRVVVFCLLMIVVVGEVGVVREFAGASRDVGSSLLVRQRR